MGNIPVKNIFNLEFLADRCLGGREDSEALQLALWKRERIEIPPDYNPWEPVNLLERHFAKMPALEDGTRWKRIHIAYLNLVMSYSQAQDWYGGPGPVVWLSRQKIALKLGTTPRYVNQVENELMRLGALSWNDGPNHRRNGKRDEDGRIEWADGVNLKNLAGLLPELREVAARSEREETALKRARHALSSLRRQCRAKIKWVARQGVQSVSLASLTAEIETLVGSIRTGYRTTIEQIEEWTAALAELFDRLEALVRGPKYQESDSGEVYSSPKEGTEFPQGGTVEHPHTVQESRNDSTVQTVPTEQVEDDGASRAPAPAMGALAAEEVAGPVPGRDHERRREGADEVERQGGRAGEAVPKRFSLPAFRESLDDETRGQVPEGASEPELVEAADLIRESIGISKSGWRAACKALGRGSAAVVVMAVATKHRRDEVKKPRRYLEGIVRKAESGKFNFWAMVYGL